MIDKDQVIGDLSGASDSVTEDKPNNATPPQDGVVVPKKIFGQIANFMEKQNLKDEEEKREKEKAALREKNLQELKAKPGGDVVYDKVLKAKIEADPTISDSPARINDHYTYAVSDPNIRKAIEKPTQKDTPQHQRAGTGTPVKPPVQEGVDLSEVDKVFAENENLRLMAGVAKPT